jgi:hypothetical protein
MSLDVTGLSAYTDENKMDLIKKSLLEGRTLNYITVQPDIKSSATINILDSTLVAQAGSCGWNAAGTTEMTQALLTVNPLKINESICLDTLEGYYTQSMMNKGSYNEEIPFEQLFAEDKASKINVLIEDLLWKGDILGGAGNLALADGFIYTIDAAATAVDGNSGAVTAATGIVAANVIDIVDAMIAETPTDILDADDLVLFMGYEVYRLWAKALRDANLFHYDGAENQVDSFSQMVPGTNVKVVAVRGLNGTDRMFLSRAANFYMGTDLLNDAEDFKIFYSEDNDEVRFRSKFKMGTQVAFMDLMVEFTLVP